MKISFLASHGGSSARAIIAAINSGALNAETGILVTNNRDSGIYQWCRENDFPVHHVSSLTAGGEDQVDNQITHLLKDSGTDIVVCSGYMKKIGQQILKAFKNRILNIHPALLPRHGGAGMFGDHVHKAVLDAGESESGATVHIVNATYDDGPIIGQSHVQVTKDDTLETLRKKVQATEPQLYINCLKQFLTAL